MPFYDYQCASCGEFSTLRRMDDRNQSCECPGCGAASQRVLVGAPMVSRLSAEDRQSGLASEDGAAASKSLQQYRSRHSGGCSCCMPAAGARQRAFSPPSSGRPTRSRSGR
jgi:putative FmdB family regulatory protein